MKFAKSIFIEKCCSTIDEALAGEKAGAHRIEFCSSLDQQGLTPKVKEIETLLNEINIPVRVILRPRNSFHISSKDKKIIHHAVIAFNKLPIEGYVTGYLTNENKIDEEFLQWLLLHTNNRKITFHKAIDSTSDQLLATKTLNKYAQIDTILSSGGMEKAYDGKARLLAMQEIYTGKIMAGGGITCENLPDFSDWPLTMFHGRRII